MSKISNKEMSGYVRSRTPFSNHNDSAFAEFKGRNIYAAYSYGYHFPMYVYDADSFKWFGNEDKYSPTTSRHQSQAHPSVEGINWVSTDQLTAIIAHDGYHNYVSDRMKGAA
jgi:hypothetical protein